MKPPTRCLVRVGGFSFPLLQHLRDHVGTAAVCVCDHVGVDVRRCADLIVPQTVRHRHRIHAVVDQHRRHRVAESVRGQMRQVVLFGKGEVQRAHGVFNSAFFFFNIG